MNKCYSLENLIYDVKIDTNIQPLYQIGSNAPINFVRGSRIITVDIIGDIRTDVLRSGEEFELLVDKNYILEGCRIGDLSFLAGRGKIEAKATIVARSIKQIGSLCITEPLCQGLTKEEKKEELILTELKSEI